MRVRAKAYVVSGGAIASPWLLMRSNIATKTAGKRIGFNLASPVTALFDKPVNAFDGVQISHYLEEPNLEYVIETWFNPVVSQALNMPGWLGEHWCNMHRYSYLAAAGVLVGTTTREAHLKRALTGGPDIVYTPGKGDKANKHDFDRLLEGLAQLGRIFLAANAKCVMFDTFHYEEFRREHANGLLEGLRRHVRDAADLAVGTGHPQGGCAISGDSEDGVVDQNFRVHGFRERDLYVCDASVFPSAITVNPQLTVMALANLAGNTIDRDLRSRFGGP
jgi:choline dehydrogenase-like flavoprotein